MRGTVPSNHPGQNLGAVALGITLLQKSLLERKSSLTMLALRAIDKTIANDIVERAYEELDQCVFRLEQ
ncbi:hypothetical protein N7486_011385 [Penicillium sp. IBT 16267x]|nr:hypothetical protein N7486_011385 [Penicillium sp. IBT 16267x]